MLQISDNDPAKWALALNNVSNIQAGVGTENVDVEIVAYGPGIPMLKNGSPVAQRIAAALKSGVEVVACQNTMNAHHLSNADVLTDIGCMLSRVVEPMQKQQEAYAYRRP